MEKSKALWYLASPYSSVNPRYREARFEAISELAAGLVQQGLFPLVPISHTHPIEVYGHWTSPRPDWLAFDEPFMDACVGMLVAALPGVKHSTGVRVEIERFLAQSKPIYIVLPTPDRLRPMKLLGLLDFEDAAVVEPDRKEREARFTKLTQDLPVFPAPSDLSA